MLHYISVMSLRIFSFYRFYLIIKSSCIYKLNLALILHDKLLRKICNCFRLIKSEKKEIKDKKILKENNILVTRAGEGT